MWLGMLSQEQFADSGLPLSLIRLAAGIEDTADPLADAGSSISISPYVELKMGFG